jgi:hypothetical protein
VKRDPERPVRTCDGGARPQRECLRSPSSDHLLCGILSVTKRAGAGVTLSRRNGASPIPLGCPPTSSKCEGWEFAFPQGRGCTDEKCLACITSPAAMLRLSHEGPALTATFRIEATGSPIFGSNTETGTSCHTPASLRFFLQKMDDALYEPNGRFWSNPVSTILSDGEFALTASLLPDQWTNVLGLHDPNGFSAL